MLAARKIKRVIMAVIGGMALAFGLAVAGLLGLAPAGLAILSLESQRAKRWLDKARDVVRRTNPQTKKETV
jgi:hypothetical protein